MQRARRPVFHEWKGYILGATQLLHVAEGHNEEWDGGYKFGGRADNGMYENGFTVGVLAPENVQINIDSNQNDPDISGPSQNCIHVSY